MNSGLDVELSEPDVSPLQLQGPKSAEIMQAIFGDEFNDLKYYWFKESELNGCLLYTSPSPRDATLSRMPSSA